VRNPILPAALGALAALLAACPPSDSSPIHTAATTFDSKAQRYQLSQVDLTTIFPADGGDFVSLKGSVAEVIGGAQVIIDGADPALTNATSDAELRTALLKDPGTAVEASFVKSGSVEWPADFHSQNMVTTYYNFERAFTFYSSLGWTQAQAGTPKVYYFPKYIETAISKDPLTDNAAFFAVLGGFMILPFSQLQEVPLPMNEGIIGHEYSHFMVNTRVYDRQAIPSIYGDWGGLSSGTPAPAANLLKSLDEGFADLFGTGVTCFPDYGPSCDPNFIAASIRDAATARNLAGIHCFDQTLSAHLTGDDLPTFTGGSHEYQLGTVLASSVWRAANDPKVTSALGPGPAIQLALKTVYDSLDDPTGGLGLKQYLVLLKSHPDQFTPDFALANIIVSHAADPVLGTALCSAFMDRLGTLANTDCQTLCAGTISGPPPSCICACQNYPQALSNGECQ